MKRYRVIVKDFDTRASILRQQIDDAWEPTVKETWRLMHAQVMSGLAAEFGPHQLDAKLKNLTDLGPSPFSIIAFHNRFLRQARNAFVIGSYYPALTGACALGERILNHLILKLRDHFRGTPAYKHIYRKHSFDDWSDVIDVLDVWSVLLPDVTAAFREFAAVRNRSLHFTPETDTNDRAIAIEALTVLTSIVERQFGSHGTQPWFIDSPEGFLKKAVEEQPFIREIYLPNCVLVGPHHRLEHVGDGWKVNDAHVYSSTEISDQEFVEMHKASLEAERARREAERTLASTPT